MRNRRRRARHLAMALAIVLGCSILAPFGGPDARASSGRILVTGHGWGHGRGMGQWGSLGYAVDHGWGYRQILARFYGDTVVGTIGNPQIRVRIEELSGLPLIATTESGRPPTSIDGSHPPRPGTAVRIDRAGAGSWHVYDGDSCSGPWRLRASNVGAGAISVHPSTSGKAGLVQACLRSGSPAELRGDTRYYRGAVHAVDDGSHQRAVNVLAMQSYLRGVVPRESPAYWGGLTGAGTGMDALRAQSVAARSYARAENRWSYAQTCDTISCQVYGGYGERRNGTFVAGEQANTNQAITDTAGEVRLRDGVVQRTEFSASTGGYTAGGVFPAVVDHGDSTSRNPHHNWSVEIPVSTVEAEYDRGTFITAEITNRNGLGAEGGRVLKMRLRFTGGDVYLTGDDFRRDFNLRSNWFSIANMAPADAKTQPAGGYTLAADGSLHRFGAAPAPTGAPALSGSSGGRGLALTGRSGRVGFVLDGWGGLHAVNGARQPEWTPHYFPGEDVARGIAVGPGTRVRGYWVHRDGGVFPFSTDVSGGRDRPPDVAPVDLSGHGAAAGIVVRPDGASGYVVAADGTVHPFGGAPAASSTAVPSGRTAVGLVLRPDGTSGYVVDDGGVLRSFGGAPAPAGSLPSGTVAVAGRADGISGYGTVGSGTVSPFGGALAAGSSATGATRRAIALIAEPRGYVVDSRGGLHRFGGAPTVSGPRFDHDITRGIAMRPDGSGLVLDGYGGLHGFAPPGASQPGKPRSKGYWLGWDIARDVVLLPGRWDAGYVLDGWGAMHPFALGGAAMPPAVRGGPYWKGWDIARGATLLPDGTGGYIVDGWGATHAFAIGSHPKPPRATGHPYWKGWDIARGVVSSGPGSGWVLDGWGGLHRFGNATGKGSWWWEGHDLAVGLTYDGRGWAVYADRWGGLHSGPASAPAISGTSYWPGSPRGRDAAAVPR